MNAFIGLGSNLGDSAAELHEGFERLASAGCRVLRRSSVYRTEPVDAEPSLWFANAVVRVDFDGSPHQLLSRCQAIEAERGRARDRVRNAPRSLDLDLLLVEDVVLTSEELTLPHPRLHLRRFVLVPLAEIAPDALHPTMRRTARELLAACPDDSRVERLQPAVTP